MPELFSLTCPTCGANLQIAGETDQFHCEHCGTQYLLDHKIGEMDESTRRHLLPVVTYTQSIGQWLRVGEYDVVLHGAAYDKRKGERIFYIHVEYENKTDSPVKYRHDQWIVFDTDGHTFEPAKDFTHPHCISRTRSISA